MAKWQFMAELRFFTGTMDSGKSTLAMQMDYNLAHNGHAGLVFTAHDRGGTARITSRIGLETTAIEVGPEFDFYQFISEYPADVIGLGHAAALNSSESRNLATATGEASGTQGGMGASDGTGATPHPDRPLEYLVCDEAQFYTPAQIDQLARVVDDFGLDVFAFGLTTDFRARLFPGSARLLELADQVDLLQLRTLCWCGARGTHNARKVNGEMVVEGDLVVLGDTKDDGTSDAGAGTMTATEVTYEVLCRAHHMRREVSASH